MRIVSRPDAGGSGGLRQRGVSLRVSPFDPCGQGLHVLQLDRGARPNPQSGRCVAIEGDVMSDARLVQPVGNISREGGLCVDWETSRQRDL